MSFVRAYSKHEASYIFRVKDLDLVGVAKSFGLLRLPRMPELTDVSRNGWEDADVDVSSLCHPPCVVLLMACCPQWSAYAYAEKAREAKRLAAAAEQTRSTAEGAERKAERLEQKKANAAWSNKLTRKEEQLKRKEKKDRKRKWQKEHQEPVAIGGSATKKRGSEEDGSDVDDGDDWEELAREERMAKKVKRGAVSQEVFDGEFGGL